MPIAIRLFLMVALSMAAVAATGAGVIRWRLAAEAPTATGTFEDADIDGLVGRLAAAHRAHGGWAFLPAGAEARATWLRRQAGAWAPGDLRTAPASSTLGYRVALSDARGVPLAGVTPDRWLVMLASIDRQRRPIVVDGQAAGYLTVAKPHDPDDGLVVAFLIRQQRNLALLAALAAILGGIAAGVVAFGFRRPIGALVRGTRALGQGRYATRVDARRSDELGELASTFNALAARLDASEQERRQWVADTSHELRTPLAVLRAQLEAMQDGLRPLAVDSLGASLRQVELLDRLIDDLYALARADIGELVLDLRSTDMRALVADVWAAFAGRFRDHGLDASLAGRQEPLLVVADPLRLRQVLVNLLENSARYTDAGGKVRVSVDADGGDFRLQVDDGAPGVPEALLERLGERFFRLDPSRSRQTGGAGLGLALCRRIVEAHGGRLAFAPSPWGGLRATLVLPLER